LDRTLFVLKPDAVIRRYVGAYALKTLLNENFNVVAFKETQISRDFAEIHYAEHKGKFFYDWLIDFITLSNVIVTVIEGENVVKRVRELLGSTMAHKAAPDTIRGRYGIWGGINVAHASDSPETADREVNLWITNLDLEDDGEKATTKTQEYTSRWETSKQGDHTKELRELCKRFDENRISMDTFEEQLKYYLRLDAEEEKDVEGLAKIIIGNMLLSKK